MKVIIDKVMMRLKNPEVGKNLEHKITIIMN